MTEAIYWARLTDLIPAIQALPQAQDTVMMLERLPVTWLDEQARQNGIQFDYFDPAIPFNEWERGRIFNSQGELRWEKMDGHFQTVYVGAEVALPGFSRDETLNLAQASLKTKLYYLWGQRLGAKQLAKIDMPEDETWFIELVVPRLLQYPVSGQANRVKLQTVEYFDPANGQRLYYRFQGVQAI